MESQWILKPVPDEHVGGRSVPRILSLLLGQRGITEDSVENFLRPMLRDLQDPYLLPDMAQAVERILKAVDEKQTICVLVTMMSMESPRWP